MCEPIHIVPGPTTSGKSIVDRLARLSSDGTAPAHAPHLGPCRVWRGKLNVEGYGVIVVNGKHRRAHVIAWGQAGMPELPQGYDRDHVCRNRACIRIDHLQAVPHRINVLRGVSPAAINAKKTKCHRGHPFTGDNVRHTPRGRNCRACERNRRTERKLAAA